jgi:hypothetical protein
MDKGGFLRNLTLPLAQFSFGHRLLVLLFSKSCSDMNKLSNCEQFFLDERTYTTEIKNVFEKALIENQQCMKM